MRPIFGLAAALALAIAPASAVAAPGDADTGFGSNGFVTTTLNGHGVWAGVAISGGAVVAGGAEYGYGAAVGRFDANGTPDSAFDGDGIATAPEANGYSTGGATVDADGRPVTAGDFSQVAGATFVLRRWTTAGAPDPNFGNNGRCVVTFSGYSVEVRDVITLPDRSVVAVGVGYPNMGPPVGVLAKVTSGGIPDATFGTAGKVTTAFTQDFGPSALARQADGKLVAAGTGDSGQFALARYNANGSLDDGSMNDTDPNDHFGSNGKATTTVGAAGQAFASSVTMMGDKIVVGGVSDSNARVALARYNTDGSLDTSFDGDGLVTTLWTDRYAFVSTDGVAIDSAGNIVVGGYGGASQTSHDIVASRYAPNGALDPTFGSGGRASGNAGPRTFSQAMALDGSDRAVIAGGVAPADANADSQPLLARFLGGGGAVAAPAPTTPTTTGTSGVAAGTLGTGPQAIQGMEITQGTQYDFVPDPVTNGHNSSGEPGINFTHNAVDYNGVKLAAGKTTLVRVFVRAPADATAQLVVFKNGKFFGSLRHTNTKTPDLSDKPVTDKRRNRNGALVYELPADWASGTLKIVATLRPKTVSSISYCTTCDRDDALATDGVLFRPTRRFAFRVVELWDGKPITGSYDYGQAMFARAITMFPTSDSGVDVPVKPQAVIRTDGKTTLEAHNLLVKWDQDNKLDATNVFTAGVANYDIGYTSAQTGLFGGFKGVGCVLNGTSYGSCSGLRPVSSVAPRGNFVMAALHEFYHGFGMPHSSYDTPVPADSTCQKSGVFSLAQNDKGLLQGVGIDLRSSVKSDGTYPIVPDPGRTTGKPDFDLMTYCNYQDDVNAWVAPRTWDAAFGKFEDVGAARRSAALRAHVAAAAPLSVWAVATPDGVKITNVGPAPAAYPPALGDTGFHVVAHDAAGGVLGDIPLAAADSASHISPNFTALRADVPAGAASLDIVRDGAVVATRARSAHAPAVKVTAPKARAVVGRSKNVAVTWTATDADKDALSTSVDYSLDGGRTYREVFTGATGNSAQLPSFLLAGSRKARVRVRVNDGFNETAAQSAVFTAVGAPPAVKIVSPAASLRLKDDGRLVLQGSASDDRGKVLSGKSLRWFVGRRAVGTGKQLSVAGVLAPGRRTVRLVATDARHRKGTAAVTVNVAAVAPTFTTLTGPAKVSKTAHSVSVLVASSIPGRLQLGKRRFTVGVRARRLTLPLPKITGKTVSLALKLSAYGKTSTSTLVLPVA